MADLTGTLGNGATEEAEAEVDGLTGNGAVVLSSWGASLPPSFGEQTRAVPKLVRTEA
jgi:hypothetical protein